MFLGSFWLHLQSTLILVAIVTGMYVSLLICVIFQPVILKLDTLLTAGGLFYLQ